MKNLHKIKESIVDHKGRKIEVYFLIDVKSGKRVLIQTGEDLNIVLSPELINALKNIRGVKDVFWISRDLEQIADFEAMGKKKPIEIDWEN